MVVEAELSALLEAAERAVYEDADEARRCVAAVLARAGRSPADHRARVQALTLRSVLLAQGGDPLAALSVAVPLVDEARALGAPRLLARLQNVLGAVYDVLDQPERAVSWYARAIAQAVALGDAELADKARMNTGVALQRMGESHRAMAEYDAVIARGTAEGRGDRLARAHQNRAISLIALGRLDEAEADLVAGRACLARVGHARTEAFLESVAASLARRRGDLAKARTHLETAVALAERHHLALVGVEARSELASVCLAQSPPDLAAARRCADEALALARAFPGAEQHHDAVGVHAAVLEAEGRLAEALDAERRRYALAETRWQKRFASRVATLRVEQDLAALERERAALADRNAQLEALAEARRDGMSTVAHDLRSRLTVLSMQGEVLAEHADPRVRASGGRVSEAVLAMVDLTDRVLGADGGPVAWVAAGARAVDLGDALTSVHGRYQPLAARKRQTLSLTQRGLGAVHANAGALDQVLTNLVDNAIKYSPQGGATEIRGRRDGDVAVVEVADRGPGLTPEDLRRVFGRAARLSARPTGGEASHGLGLYAVRRLVEAMGGGVEAAAREGGGPASG